MKPALFLSLILLASTPVQAAQDYLRQFPLHLETKFFVFHYRRNPEKVAEIARFADGFVKLINRDFFKANYAYPITVLVLEDRERFQDFLRREMEMKDPPGFGIFFPKLKIFATYEGSGLGTFAHEILHPLVDANLPHPPLWAVEGIPTFFEKFYGYWKEDELVLKFGFQNPWRIQALGGELATLDLKKILAYPDTQGRFRECEQRMVSMFLWKQGRFKRLLSLLGKGDMQGYHSWFEAAMEMDLEKVVPLWQEYLKDVAAHAMESLLLPVSTVLRDEAAYKEFDVWPGLKPER